MAEKKITERAVSQELERIWGEFKENKISVDAEILTILFKMREGDIFYNDDLKIAIGFVPAPQNLIIYFFEMILNDKLRYVDSRGIHISERIEIDLKKAIDLCKVLKSDDSGIVDKSYQ